MTWRLQSPGHQQPWYWLMFQWHSGFSTRMVNVYSLYKMSSYEYVHARLNLNVSWLCRAKRICDEDYVWQRQGFIWIPWQLLSSCRAVWNFNSISTPLHQEWPALACHYTPSVWTLRIREPPSPNLLCVIASHVSLISDHRFHSNAATSSWSGLVEGSSMRRQGMVHDKVSRLK